MFTRIESRPNIPKGGLIPVITVLWGVLLTLMAKVKSNQKKLWLTGMQQEKEAVNKNSGSC